MGEKPQQTRARRSVVQYAVRFQKAGSRMANSKTHAVEEKHRRAQRNAKEKLRLHLAGKLDAEKLPSLAKRYLARHSRMTKRG